MNTSGDHLKISFPQSPLVNSDEEGNRPVSLDSIPEEYDRLQSQEPLLPNEQVHHQEASRWTFYVEMLIILTVLFFAESSRGMVMPSLNLYVDSVSMTSHSHVVHLKTS